MILINGKKNENYISDLSNFNVTQNLYTQYKMKITCPVRSPETVP